MKTPNGYWLDGTRRVLGHGAALLYEPERRGWRTAPDQVRAIESHHGATPMEALTWVQTESGFPIRPPVGVIGPREASPQHLAEAERIGADLARAGLTVLCGGKGGVMEAVCKGAARHNGLTIGLLPDSEWDAANPFVRVPIASGIGVARNAIIARAAVCVIAIGGGYGTLSEIAYACQFGRPVLCFLDAPEVAGTHRFDGWHDGQGAFADLMLDRPA